MIILHLNYADGCDARKIESAVRAVRQRFAQRLEDETLGMLEVHGELPFPIMV